MIIVFIEEPERGGAERLKGEIAADVVNTSYWADIKALATKFVTILLFRVSLRKVGVTFFQPHLRLLHCWLHSYRFCGGNTDMVGTDGNRAQRCV